MQPSKQLSVSVLPVPGSARTLAFALAFLMLPGAFAEGPAIQNYSTKTDLQIARDVAPYVYFHENEHNWPGAWEDFLFYSTLRRESDRAFIANGLSPSELLRLTEAGNIDSSTGKDKSAGYFLDAADWMYPGTADFTKTKAYLRVHDRPARTVDVSIGFGQSVRVTFPPQKEIQFWFFFPFNGCQTHRVHALGTDLRYHTSYFQMCDAARHEGDVEAVTVFINKSTGRPMGIATTRHGANVYTQWEQIKSNGTHPIVYSAWASHAMYTTVGRKSLDGAPPDMRWVAGSVCKIVNIDSWNIYDLPTADGRRLDPSHYSNNLVMMDANTPITKYHGRWGLTKMNNWSVRLPSAPGYDSNMGQDVVKYVADEQIRSCLDVLQRTVDIFKSLDGTLTGDGTDWFSKGDWLNGMTIDKFGQ